jgi:hypothetical protein
MIYPHLSPELRKPILMKMEYILLDGKVMLEVSVGDIADPRRLDESSGGLGTVGCDARGHLSASRQNLLALDPWGLG